MPMTVILYTKHPWTAGAFHGEGTIEIRQLLWSDITIDTRGSTELIRFRDGEAFQPITNFAKIEIIP